VPLRDEISSLQAGPASAAEMQEAGPRAGFRVGDPASSDHGLPGQVPVKSPAW